MTLHSQRHTIDEEIALSNECVVGSVDVRDLFSVGINVSVVDIHESVAIPHDGMEIVELDIGKNDVVARCDVAHQGIEPCPEVAAIPVTVEGLCVGNLSFGLYVHIAGSTEGTEKTEETEFFEWSHG